jgi:hypothetical protein
MKTINNLHKYSFVENLNYRSSVAEKALGSIESCSNLLMHSILYIYLIAKEPIQFREYYYF